jgi:2'-5' RNA ligase
MQAALQDKQSLYFIAIVPPDEIACEVTKWKEYMRDHFASERALRSPAHITLFAPFFLSQKDEKALVDCVTETAKKFNPFRLDLNEFKAFKPRVIYIDVMESYPMDKLQEEIVAATFSQKAQAGH